MRDFFETPVSFFLVAAAIVVLVFLSMPLVPHYGSDAEWYISIANGHIGDVIKPFSGRFLQPFLAGQLSPFFGISVDQSFFFIAILSLLLFLFLNAFLLKKISLPPLLLFPIFLLPYLGTILNAFFLPDLFYGLLVVLFFVFLFYDMEVASLLVLFPLFLTRESTVLLGAVLLAVSLFRSKKLFAVAVFVVMIISIFTVQNVADIGLPNVHNLGNLSYLVLKVPYNFLNNIFGVKLWVNTLSNNCDPVFTSGLPMGLSVGSINKVGFCGFDASFPLNAVLTFLTIFGIAPLVLFYLLVPRLKAAFRDLPFWLVVAVIYGLACYFMSVFATGAIQKFMGYGWPAFLLAVPFLVSIFVWSDRRFLVKLSLIQLFVAWLPVAVSGIKIGSIFGFLIAFPLVLMAYFYAYRLLRGQESAERPGIPN